MLEKTWIGATGQRWKIYVLFGLLVVTCAWLAGTIAFLEQLPPDVGALVLLGLFLSIVGFFAWTFWSLACPFCGDRVVWTTLRRVPHDNAVQIALFLRTHCPSPGCRRSFFPTGRRTHRS